MITVAVIIVTHNSEPFLDRCLQAVRNQQGVCCTIVVVDSGSDECTYLERHSGASDLTIRKTANVGFAAANNQGLSLIDKQSDYILFLNPDAFLAEPDVLSKGIAACENETDLACVTGKLLGYDIGRGVATGLLDSTGIFRKWYGRWYDRGRGESDRGQYDRRQEVPAACGAFLLMKRSLLDRFSLAGQAVFDSDFSLYKEDIELGIRIGKAGLKVVYDPNLTIFHCRGWQNRRKKMPYHLRETAARSEVVLYCKHFSGYIVWALLKYLLVRLFRV